MLPGGAEILERTSTGIISSVHRVLDLTDGTYYVTVIAVCTNCIAATAAQMLPCYLKLTPEI